MVAALAIRDVVEVYLIPVAALAVCWLLAAAWTYLVIRMRPGSAVRRDLEHRVYAKQGLPSGAMLTLSFRYVALSLLGDNCVQATVMYRLSAWLAQHRLASPARVVHAFSKFVTHADISPYAAIGPGLYLYHGLGTVIGKGTVVGADALVCQGVTTGGGPTIGDGVKLWAGAKVIGRVTVGSGAEIGANGVVISNVPPDVVAVGVPATRFLPKRADGAQHGVGS